MANMVKSRVEGLMVIVIDGIVFDQNSTKNDW